MLLALAHLALHSGRPSYRRPLPLQGTSAWRLPRRTAGTCNIRGDTGNCRRRQCSHTSWLGWFHASSRPQDISISVHVAAKRCGRSDPTALSTFGFSCSCSFEGVPIDVFCLLAPGYGWISIMLISRVRPRPTPAGTEQHAQTVRTRQQPIPSHRPSLPKLQERDSGKKTSRVGLLVTETALEFPNITEGHFKHCTADQMRLRFLKVASSSLLTLSSSSAFGIAPSALRTSFGYTSSAASIPPSFSATCSSVQHRGRREQHPFLAGHGALMSAWFGGPTSNNDCTPVVATKILGGHGNSVDARDASTAAASTRRKATPKKVTSLFPCCCCCCCCCCAAIIVLLHLVFYQIPRIDT